MNTFLLFFIGILYVIIGINYYLDDKTGLCIAFIAYALANVGLWMAGR